MSMVSYLKDGMDARENGERSRLHKTLNASQNIEKFMKFICSIILTTRYFAALIAASQMPLQ